MGRWGAALANYGRALALDPTLKSIPSAIERLLKTMPGGDLIEWVTKGVLKWGGM